MSSFKEFKPTSWVVENRTTVYLITIIMSLVGIFSYNTLPKEQFPDIVVPTIYVQTIYPGSSPKDIENLITKPIEKQIKSISGVKKLKSQSIQDFSIITVEFGTDVDVKDAKQKVKDEVDKAKTDLPTDLDTDPTIMEVNFSDVPIMYVNISGDIPLQDLKKYADVAQDKFEAMKEITRVDMVGALDREIQVNLDLQRMAVSGLSMDDVINAIRYENMRISGGNIDVGTMKRSVSVSGEFASATELENMIIRSGAGATMYLRDVAEVIDGFKEKESYARLDGKNVITLNIVKRAGENLIDASDKVRGIIKELQTTGQYPSNLEVVFTGDQSTRTRITLHDLINTIIIGFTLVTFILMFFMGAQNALFVALSVPLSCFLAFLIMPTLGFSLNMIVLFAFLLALGIVVDDAIVVIENTHRIFKNGRVPIKEAAKRAAGEVFLPVFSGTITTLAPFIPLAFWPGIIGKFMFFLPVTLIITLTASLLIAYLINPVFAASFMKPVLERKEKPKADKKFLRTSLIFMGIAMLMFFSGNVGAATFTLIMFGVFALYKFVLESSIQKFQNNLWPRVVNRYKRFLTRLLQKTRPQLIFWGTIVLFFISVIGIGLRSPEVVFFPQSDPNFAYVYMTLPSGTNAEETNELTMKAEKMVFEVLGKDNPIVESVISNVAVGATDPNSGDRSTASNKSKITVAFVEFAEREGQSTAKVLEDIRLKLADKFTGVELVVEKEANGPPVGKAINIEIRGDEFKALTQAAKDLKFELESENIGGVEELKSDFISSKPEALIVIDRQRANSQGISTATVGMSLRNSIYGAEASKFKDANDDYPIMVRVKKEQVNDIDELLNMRITYRDMVAGGMIRQIPLRAIADVKYANTYGGINRLDQKRVITLASNVLPGYAPNEVVAKVQAKIDGFKAPMGIEVAMTGEQEQQAETSTFLGRAMMSSILIIILVLMLQFNSIAKTLLILSEILFSVIGVLLGLAIFDMSISIVMTGIGIVALVGIVVRNGILLVEFIDILRGRGVPLKQAIIEACKTRMTPVLLTATSTILGLVPLAVGLNMDFGTLLTELNPHIYFGGDSVAFWGPLSWTMIFGLGFASAITLILVPCMYLMYEQTKKRVYGSWLQRGYDYDEGVSEGWENRLDE
jgi:multidrug efflux pump